MSIAYENVLKDVRDCVKKFIEEGARDKHQFRDMRYGIICELRRLGCDEEDINQAMMDWNAKNYRELSSREFKQQVTSLIKWIFKKDAKAGCKYFKDNGYCIPCCEFNERHRIKANANLSKEVFYSEDEIEKFLNQYDKNKHVRECAAIYKIIDRKRIELGITRDNTVFMALREIQQEYWKRGYSDANTMDISKLVNELKDSGLLEIARKGKSGEFKGEANGYKLRIPDDVYKEDLLNYKDKETANP